MKFTEEKAQEIIQKFQLKSSTIKTWRHRGEIPNEYFEKRITLRDVISDTELNPRIEKFGKEMERMINTRKFREGQDYNYYMTCLRSLCAEGKKNLLTVMPPTTAQTCAQIQRGGSVAFIIIGYSM